MPGIRGADLDLVPIRDYILWHARGLWEMEPLEVHGLPWRQSRGFVSYWLAVAVSSCGDTVEEARVNPEEAVRLFLEEVDTMGTLDSTLTESEFRKIPNGWLKDEGTWVGQ